MEDVVAWSLRGDGADLEVHHADGTAGLPQLWDVCLGEQQVVEALHSVEDLLYDSLHRG